MTQQELVEELIRVSNYKRQTNRRDRPYYINSYDVSIGRERREYYRHDRWR